MYLLCLSDLVPAVDPYLEDMPLDDWSSGILQSLLPMFEPRLVLFVLTPAQLYLSNGIPTANQIVVANLENKPVTASLAKLRLNSTVMSRVTRFMSISSMINTNDSFQYGLRLQLFTLVFFFFPILLPFASNSFSFTYGSDAPVMSIFFSFLASSTATNQITGLVQCSAVQC